VQVDGRVHAMERGTTFRDNFRFVKIDGKSATFLFGDHSFELCDT
jgi:hypothetical protein